MSRGSPADVGVVSGGGGGLASDFVSPSGSCLTRPFHAKDVGGGSEGFAPAAGPFEDKQRKTVGWWHCWYFGRWFLCFFSVVGAFWGPFVGVLATWWASFWNLDGLRCLLGAQGILESEFGHIFHHFGGHFGRLFRRFCHHFLVHFWRSHFISLLMTF